MVVKARCEISKRPVSIHKINFNPTDQYALIKVLRELSILQFLQKSKSATYTPIEFDGILDVFAPIVQIKTKTIETLFIVTEEKTQTLSERLKGEKIELGEVRAILY